MIRSLSKLVCLLALLPATLVAEPAQETWRVDNLEALKRKPVLTVSPNYPAKPRRERREGRVIVCFKIYPDGSVRKPYVFASSDRAFNRTSLRAIKASRFVAIDDSDERIDACRTYRYRLDAVEPDSAAP